MPGVVKLDIRGNFLPECVVSAAVRIPGSVQSRSGCGWGCALGSGLCLEVLDKSEYF